MPSIGQIIGCAALGGILSACAATPPTTEKMASTSATIRAAQEIGAQSVPEASYYLQLSLEESEHGRNLIAKGEKARAASILTRAQADAELALALGREDQMRHDAQMAIDRAQALSRSSQ
jgi:hypothetical protein